MDKYNKPVFKFIYLLLVNLETIGLLIYNLIQKSDPQGRIWLYFSAERLILNCAILLVTICVLMMTYFTVRDIRCGQFIVGKYLDKESSLWTIMSLSLGIIVLCVWSFVLPAGMFGKYQAIFLNMKSVLFWLLVLAGQTFLFTLLGYLRKFIEKPCISTPEIKTCEMFWLILIFGLSVTLKLVFVLPTGFGMLKDVGETKYLYMLQYFNEGIFLHSATEFTTHYPPLYALMLMAAYSIRDFAYEGIKLINALAASSLVFPLYFLARRFFDRKTSLYIIVVASLIPFQFQLPIRLLSENLYFPLLLSALYLIFTQPANFRFRFTWDCLTGFVLGLLYLTRYISLALIPFLMLAWWLKPFGDQPAGLRITGRKLIHASAILFLAGLTFSPWVMIGLENGLPVSQMLGFGIAANTNPAQLTVINLLKWIALYGAYFILLAAPVLNLLGISLGSFRLKNLAMRKIAGFNPVDSGIGIQLGHCAPFLARRLQPGTA